MHTYPVVLESPWPTLLESSHASHFPLIVSCSLYDSTPDFFYCTLCDMFRVAEPNQEGTRARLSSATPSYWRQIVQFAYQLCHICQC